MWEKYPHRRFRSLRNTTEDHNLSKMRSDFLRELPRKVAALGPCGRLAVLISRRQPTARAATVGTWPVRAAGRRARRQRLCVRSARCAVQPHRPSFHFSCANFSEPRSDFRAFRTNLSIQLVNSVFTMNRLTTRCVNEKFWRESRHST